MKSMGLLLIIFVSAFQGFGQTIASSSVPKIVKDKFEKSYANVTDVEWRKQGKNYQASFKSNNAEWTSSYDGKGNPVNTGKTIPISALPQTVRDYFSWNLPGKKMLSAQFMNDSKGEQSFEVKSDDGTYVFDKQGHFIRKMK